MSRGFKDRILAKRDRCAVTRREIAQDGNHTGFAAVVVLKDHDVR